MNTSRNPRPRTLRHLCLATLAVWLPAISATCLAADPVPGGPAASKTVSFVDLNLRSADGLSQLYERIVAAANEVCGDTDSRSLAAWSEHRACTSQSIAHAVAAVGIPELTAMHLRRTGHGLIKAAVVAQR